VRSVQFASKAEMDTWMGRMRPHIQLLQVLPQRRRTWWEGLPRETVTYTVYYEDRAH
jgi:hypothetical protein